MTDAVLTTGLHMSYNIAMLKSISKAASLERFGQVVLEHPDVSNATVRIGVWLIAVADRLNVTSLEGTYRSIRDGFQGKDGFIVGTGSHIDTIKASMKWLENQGVISISGGKAVGFGHHANVYTILL